MFILKLICFVCGKYVYVLFYFMCCSEMKDSECIKDEFFVLDEFEWCDSLIFIEDKEESGIE